MNISKFIAKKISNYHNPNSIGYQLRKRRSKILKTMIDKVYTVKGYVKILDVGGTRNYWGIIPIDWLRSRNIRITLLNMQPLNETLEDDLFVEVIGDGRFLQFPDKSFDICHSNSVIEHVGSFDQMKSFASEILRVGQKYFIQTPSFWFPIEPHAMFPFFHWLPVTIRKKIIKRYAIGHWRKAISDEEAHIIVSSAQLLKKSQPIKLFPDANEIYTEWLLLPKSYIVLRN